MTGLRREFTSAWATALNGPTRLLLWLSCASFLAYGIVMPIESEAKHYVLKAMGAGLLSVAALMQMRSLNGALLALALGVGAIGDVLIALPGGFINGLIAFLIGHLFYIALFIRHRNAWADVGFNDKLLLLAVIGSAIALNIMLEPHVGEAGMAVKIYTLVLTAMAGCAFMARLSMLVRIGAVAFFVSDGLIAIGRFLGPTLGSNPFWQDLPYFIWGLYAIAQLFIFLGVRKST